MINFKDINVGDIIQCKNDYSKTKKEQIIYILSKFDNKIIFKNISINEKPLTISNEDALSDNGLWKYKLIKAK